MSLNRVGSSRRCVATCVVALCATGLTAAQAQLCSEWSTMFPGDGGLYSVQVNALVVFDGELYLGGDFDTCMGRAVNYVARWNGRRWAGVGAGLHDPAVSRFVCALAAFDDPNSPDGPCVYAGVVDGVFREPNNPDDSNEAWAPMGVTDAPVRALAVYQGELYAAGEFTCIRTPDPNDPNAVCDPNDPNQARQYIARWDGSAWQDVGGGVDRDPNDPNGPILALTVFDDGGGEALFAGGTFLHAGGVSASRVARWRNGAWTALGTGIDDPNTVEVHALTGWGDRLYVGGTFVQAGGVPARGIAAAVRDSNDAWTWSALAPGLWGSAGKVGDVRSLAVLDTGAGASLYVGGRFISVGDPNDPNALPAWRIAKWDGTVWSSLSHGFDEGMYGQAMGVYCLAAYNDGLSSAVYAGGSFARADGLSAPRIARFKSGKWSPLGRAPGGMVYALRGIDAWHHPRLFVGGCFTNVDATYTGSLASWDGATWRTLGTTNTIAVNALGTFDDGSGLDLYIGGGDFSFGNDLDEESQEASAGGFIARGRMVPQDPNDPNDPSDCNVWNWRWTNTADPNDPNIPTSCTGAASGAVHALIEYLDPNDPDHPTPLLYAAGKFTEIDGQPVRYIGRLNVVDPNDPNHPWEEVGDPNGPGHPQGDMLTLAVCPDLTDAQPALYAGGVGGVYKWRDNTWSHVGDDTVCILSLGVYQDPNDPQLTLYAGGDNYLKKWTADGWGTLDPNIPIGSSVMALHVYDDGRGPALYVGGWYPFPGTTRMGRWDGHWEYLANDVGDHVWALGALADGLSERGGLYVGGHFLMVGNDSWGDTDSQYIARWGCLTACRGDLNYDGEASFADINPFVLALASPADYAAAYHPLAEVNAAGEFVGGLVLFLGDLNCDGSVGFSDINPFVQRLADDCCSAECGPCEEQEQRGMNAMRAAPSEGGGELSPEDMAALLAGNVEPADYENLLARLVAFIAQLNDPAEAAYWEAVYEALSQ